MHGALLSGVRWRTHHVSAQRNCTSGGLPIFGSSLRLGELVATFALAQDNAFGQPLESQLRSCLLAAWLSEAAGYDQDLRDTVYWVALLRYVGCTGHAHEVATVFGDEIAIRAQTLVHDAANPAEVMRDVIAYATARHPVDERVELAESLRATAHDWAVNNFASGCEVADMLLRRLDLPRDAREALQYTFERWNGTGYPAGAIGEDIPSAMRVVHLSHDMEALGRLLSTDQALDAVRERRARTYDPELSDIFAAHGAEWFARLDALEPWDEVLDLEPEPYRALSGAELDEALLVVADFIDLKSPYMAGHSRRCAQLCADAGRLLGLGDAAVTTLRRAALVHELGTTAVPNSIWDKPGPLTRAERDRVELHPMLTEQMLGRSPALAALNPVAAAHHERADGSGYHKRLRGDAVVPHAGLLIAADVYVALTADRADRTALSTEAAAAELRRLAAGRLLQASPVDAVLTAAGQGGRRTTTRPGRPERPGDLTDRELEVLRLAARGLQTREIAERLVISAKTVDHHIQHTYAKIGVSTRAAAALWAMQHDLVH